jgi:hypothetical protein
MRPKIFTREAIIQTPPSICKRQFEKIQITNDKFTSQIQKSNDNLQIKFKKSKCKFML